MAEQDRIYFAQRAAEEMEAALAAKHPDVEASHRQMQRRYLERALVGERSASQPSETIFGDNRSSFARVASDA